MESDPINFFCSRVLYSPSYSIFFHKCKENVRFLSEMGRKKVRDLLLFASLTRKNEAFLSSMTLSNIQKVILYRQKSGFSANIV